MALTTAKGAVSSSVITMFEGETGLTVTPAAWEFEIPIKGPRSNANVTNFTIRAL
jgi:hypothetical protein